MTHQTLSTITNAIIERSKPTRQAYLDAMKKAGDNYPYRHALSCGNLAHGFAACGAEDKTKLKGNTPNIGIVTAYNDMLSAHHPYKDMPDFIKHVAATSGAVAQVAGGVPAMCDGVTQGQVGMEMSLFSRDVIAMATAISLSHNMFDTVMCLGICDKIVPGLVIGALQFGYLPTIFVPSGPMPSGLPNKEKARIREQYAKGDIGKEELLEAESASYHSPGTCTFYGTANSNQMLMEMMGLQLPGSSFVNPYTPLRDALTEAATHTALDTIKSKRYTPMYEVVDEKSIVNAIVGLHATGGSTNHTLHLIAIARAAGINISWDDMAQISSIIPLLCRIYPNGEADVNHFHDAGGVPFIVQQLLQHGLLHEDVKTIAGEGLTNYTKLPSLENEKLVWSDAPTTSALPEVVSDIATPFSDNGGLKLLTGNLGRAVIKTSALKPEQFIIEAPARIFTSQQALQDAFDSGNLHGDFVAVVLGQGPKACGMPELHKLTPPLGVLQNMGFKVALVTDGRMSGASGKVPAAIHVSPEVSDNMPLAKLRDGDMIRLDATTGELNAQIDESEWSARTSIDVPVCDAPFFMGRSLFANARQTVSRAEDGASFILGDTHND